MDENWNKNVKSGLLLVTSSGGDEASKQFIPIASTIYYINWEGVLIEREMYFFPILQYISFHCSYHQRRERYVMICLTGLPLK
jgi:hypothetical protein